MKKAFTTAAAALIMLGSTVACSQKADNSAGAQNSQGAAPKKVELKLFLGGFDRFREQLDKYFAQFAEKEKKEKNIEVSINSEYPGADNAAQILKTRLATGDVPDIFSLHAVNDIPDYYKAGYLADLSSQPLAGKLIDGIKSIRIDRQQSCRYSDGKLAVGIFVQQENLQRSGIETAYNVDRNESGCSEAERQQNQTVSAQLQRKLDSSAISSAYGWRFREHKS